MIKKAVIVLSGFVYDAFSVVLIAVALIVSVFMLKARRYILARTSLFKILSSLRSLRREKIAWVLCSSIGELEQAIPVIQKLEEQGMDVFVFFHSQNGYNHANAMGYKHIALTPFDLFSVWTIIFLAGKPSFCIINRHEYWPGFVFASVVWSKLYVINAVQKKEQPVAERLWRNWIYRNCARVFVVNDIIQGEYNRVYSGDTRTDRLQQRSISEKKRNGGPESVGKT